MKLIFLVLCGLFFNFAYAEDSSKFIVNGSDATVQEYPYMAGVLNFGLSTCGGSIISQRSVLTVKMKKRCVIVA
jgi:secreted trypsin-like serine protease